MKLNKKQIAELNVEFHQAVNMMMKGKRKEDRDFAHGKLAGLRYAWAIFTGEWLQEKEVIKLFLDTK